ncbi:MAG: FG-GAP repeat protein [Thermoleophilia bacterium]
MLVFATAAASALEANGCAARAAQESSALLALQRAELRAGKVGDAFGYAVALDGDTALVGAPGVDSPDGELNVGAAYVFVRSGSSWLLQAALTAPDGKATHAFGISVALDGDTALVGAYGDDGVPGPYAADNRGSAYVFVRIASHWDLQRKLLAADGQANDFFGRSVALAGDTALVGATGAYSFRGAAYVFTRRDRNWSQQARLTAPGASTYSDFGTSVALSGDTALVGDWSDAVGGNFGQGSAYVFVRAGGTWRSQAKLTDVDGASYDRFGESVALSGDIAVVGSASDGVGDNDSQGSVCVYVRSDLRWTLQQKLTASDGAFGDKFGESVAVSGDSILIGAPSADVRGDSAQGAAYVFERSGDEWLERQKHVTATRVVRYFGTAVALSGEVGLIGAPATPARDEDSEELALICPLDRTPPETVASLSPPANSAGWNRDMTEVLLAPSDVISGVDVTYIRLGVGDVFQVYRPDGPRFAWANGLTTVGYYSVDRAGQVEQEHSIVVRIDRTLPVCRALAAVSVVRSRKVSLPYRVNDRVSPKAKVTVKIFRGGTLKQTLTLGLRSTNRDTSCRFRCTLARGTYTWKVYARDLAGNEQSKVGKAKLVVK